ncbi:MAG: 4Fe-4S dicluster domain-containing protein [Desulfobacterales bacterium]|nr:4Fe-4S dicluster domain-containing protein [Desulfobacterales bacterium]
MAATETDRNKPLWGMVIDLDKCTACGACITACKQENNIPQCDPEQAYMGRAISWMDMVVEVEGKFPHPRVKYLPRPCMHCDQPPCTKVCPVGATYRTEEGLVAQIYPRCIGCRFCMAACPYTVKYFNWYKPQWPAGLDKGHNPDVSVRPHGVVEKCTFCVHRIQKARERARAENRPLTEEDVIPACAESCPSQAIYFGDLHDTAYRVAKLYGSERAYTLEHHLGTHPKVYYLAEVKQHV